MQFVPLVDSRAWIVGRADSLKVFPAHQVAKAERCFAHARGKLFAEVQHSRFARPHHLVERKPQLCIFLRWTLRVKKKFEVDQIFLVDIYKRLPKVDRVTLGGWLFFGCRNLNGAKGLRICRDHDLLSAVELQAKSTGLQRTRVRGDSHVAKCIPFPEVAASLVGGKHKDGVTVDRIIAAGLRLCNAFRSARDWNRGDGNLDHAIKRFGQFGRYSLQAIWVGIGVDFVDLIGINKSYGRPQGCW